MESRSVLYFALDWLVVIVCGFLATLGWWAIWPAAIGIGFAQHALGELGHQAAHKLHGKVSRVLMWACFAPLAIDPDAYKRFHFAHHRNLGGLHDPEVGIVTKFRERWTEPYRDRDLWLDAIGLHADESLYVLRQMSSDRAAGLYAALMIFAAFVVGWYALLWPLAGITGLVVAHRLRARTEHKHLTDPGTTMESVPPTWGSIWYLPHGTWKHAEHHNRKVE